MGWRTSGFPQLYQIWSLQMLTGQYKWGSQYLSRTSSLVKNWPGWTSSLSLSVNSWSGLEQAEMGTRTLVSSEHYVFLRSLNRVYLLSLNILNIYILISLVLANISWSSKHFWGLCISSYDEIVKIKYSISVWFCISCHLVTDKLACLAIMSISSHRQALNIGEMVSHHLD